MHEEIKIYTIIPVSSDMKTEYVSKFLDSLDVALTCTKPNVKVLLKFGLYEYEDSEFVKFIDSKYGSESIVFLSEKPPFRLQHFLKVFNQIPTLEYNTSWITWLDADDYICENYFNDSKLQSDLLKVLLSDCYYVRRESGEVSKHNYLINLPYKGEITQGRWGFVLWGKFYKASLFTIIENPVVKCEFDMNIRFNKGFAGNEYYLIGFLYGLAQYEFMNSSSQRTFSVDSSSIAKYFWYRNPHSLTNQIDNAAMVSCIKSLPDYLREEAFLSFGKIVLSKVKYLPEDDAIKKFNEFIGIMKGFFNFENSLFTNHLRKDEEFSKDTFIIDSLYHIHSKIPKFKNDDPYYKVCGATIAEVLNG